MLQKERANEMTAEITELPVVTNRLQNLEKQIDLTNMKLQVEPGLPGFEFDVEANGKEVWSGLDVNYRIREVKR